jgi:hypothetical protein
MQRLFRQRLVQQFLLAHVAHIQARPKHTPEKRRQVKMRMMRSA